MEWLILFSIYFSRMGNKAVDNSLGNFLFKISYIKIANTSTEICNMSLRVCFKYVRFKKHSLLKNTVALKKILTFKKHRLTFKRICEM